MALTHTKENPVIVGLDIGTTKIAAIVAQRDKFGKLKILGVGKSPSFGVERGEVVNIKDTTEAIQRAIAEAKQQCGFDIKSVFVGIAGQHISSKQSRDIFTLSNPEEEITRDDLRAMMQNMHRIALEPGERIITILPQEYSVDNMHNVLNPIGMCGSRLEANYHIITGKVNAAQNIKKCVERAGLVMAGLTLEPLASSTAVLHEDELEAGVALVDIGGGTTDIAVFKNKIIRHTAVIPFAGNIITDDIMEGCRLLRPQAEKLKTNFGSALPVETQANDIISVPGIAGHDRTEITMTSLAHIINARMAEILEAVYFEIKSSGYSNSLNAGIVITGGGSQLKHLKQLAEYETGLSARIGHPNSCVAADTSEDFKHPMYATGIGLVLEGYKEFEDMTEEQKATFFPELFQTQPPITSAPEKPGEPEKEKTKDKGHSGGESGGKGTSKGPLERLGLIFKRWFEDEQVNGDFEGA